MKLKYIYITLSLIILIFNDLYADDKIEITGDILQIGLPSAALYMTFLKDDVKGRVEFWEALLSSTMITLTLKKTFYKQRPDASNFESFPSGHTAVAFSGASFITHRYGKKYAIPTYLLATFVGYSRVYAKKHYWGDVIVGAGIGILNTLLYTKPLNTNSKVFIDPIQKRIYVELAL